MTIATRGQGLSGEPQDSNTSTQNSPLSITTLSISTDTPTDEIVEPDFPHIKLAALDEKISNLRWVVPVLPEQELECLLQASIDLAKKGQDIHSEACQRFFREGLTISFTKILTDDAVSSWKYNIHLCIYHNCVRLVELCVIKLPHDWFPLLDLLAMLFNPNNKFHTFNAMRPSESVPQGATLSEEELFARPSSSDTRAPRGWLVDLINRFGSLGGFKALLERFQTGKNLTLSVVFALIRPFGFCYEYLTVHTVTKYLMPVLEIVPDILDKLTDDELKREAKNESKSDIVSAIIKSSKCLALRVPQQDEMIRTLEGFRLKMILRQLQISSFNGKMNALNEINKVIASVTYYPNRHHNLEEEEYLTSERMAKWINENRVLEIVLRDSLHQPQYVEKLEKILRFIIKERALSLSDLDAVWSAQVGKHEAIVKNVHDLLAKLAWDFSPEQLDHLFECFQSSWTNANKKQREKLLELIRRLAEDDKDGVMAHKVLTLFWNLAHSEDVPTEIMDQALSAHIKILDYSCSQERDAQKTIWLDKCVDELKQGDKWVLPALKQIREICCLYEASSNSAHSQRTHHIYYRQEVIERLQTQHSLVILVTNSLTSYLDRVRQLVKENPQLTSETYVPDNRYPHYVQVQERLNFLRFLLRDGQLWLCAEQAKQIWQCLAEQAVFASDREACFRWFSKLMGEEPDLDPGINKDFFENNILQLDPVLLTESGIKCFERFFKAVNIKEGKLKIKKRSLLTDDIDLIGIEYLWRVVTSSEEDIANRAIELLKEVHTNLGPKLQSSIIKFHETFIADCLERLRIHYDTVNDLKKADTADKNEEDSEIVVHKMYSEAIKICRILKVLQEYIIECDNNFLNERKILPLYRACRGKHLTLIVRFTYPGRQVDDMEIFTHSNDTLASLRRAVLRRIKASMANVKLELFCNGELLDTADDRKLLFQIPLRDKMLLSAKLTQPNNNTASSPESSSDSSTAGSPQHPFDGPNLDLENTLPSVIMAHTPSHVEFFSRLSNLGSTLGFGPLRDGAKNILLLMVPDTITIEKLNFLFNDFRATLLMSYLFYEVTPAQVLYDLEIVYALLMPALEPYSEKAFEWQFRLMVNCEVQQFLEMLSKNNFMCTADIPTKRLAYLNVLKISKFVMTVVANTLVQLNEEPNSLDEGPAEGNHSTEDTRPVTPIMHLRQALRTVPSPSSEQILRQIAAKVSVALKAHILAPRTYKKELERLISQTLAGEFPDFNTIFALIRIAWASSSANLQSVSDATEVLHALCDTKGRTEPLHLHPDDVILCKEALECLSLALILTTGTLDFLCRDKLWHAFIIDLVLLCPSRVIRLAAMEQFLVICTCGIASRQALQTIVPLLFSVLDTLVIENAHTSHEYFQLLCRLVNCAYVVNCPLVATESLLANEIMWLRKASNMVRQGNEIGELNIQAQEALLEGHFGLARELLCFMNPDKKHELGVDDTKGGLIQELLEDFIFPASKLMLQLALTGKLVDESATPVCSTPQTQAAAFDLLVALCVGSVSNCVKLVNMLTDMFYSDHNPPLMEWDYLPPVGPRPIKGFVGLKNAGATCYMNSVLQQLYMVESIRVGLLACDGAATDPNEDFSGEDSSELDVSQEICILDNECLEDKNGLQESRKEYNIGILKQVQAIFGHLAYSKLQYYIPKGLWRHFKLQGEPVNLREQQDAVEFFMSLIESIDEALKALGQEQIMGKILGGSYSDQKICKGCPHRYSKEEPFSVISVDIRNHSTLQDSMEQYVKGELLEGADAYYCEKCARKVVTVKRLCVKKLPPILAIQLKRFEYDFERVCAIKFNDYFEFPRDLDMEPYTVSGLAKLEGEVIDCDLEESVKDNCTKYHLSGIVVHSGQASGGHYYSYILNGETNGDKKWYKFDDGEVTECRMGDDDEMKVQCFGGEYMGEIFDPMLKRTSYRKQKRWWNAYMLFYTREDVEEAPIIKSLEDNLSLNDTNLKGMIKIPAPIENSIRKQNIKFLHHRSQFSVEYFTFIKKLVTCNAPPMARNTVIEKLNQEAEQLSMLSTQLTARFLFHTGFHTKKSLRGGALDWCEVLCLHLRASSAVRSWFANKMLFCHPHRFCEYLLGCPSNEVRTAFMKIVVSLAHFSLSDGPCPPPDHCALIEPGSTLSDYILHAILSLLHKEVSEHGRHLPNYCSLFFMYASYGIQERAQLLQKNVHATFMLVALDEGPGPAIKYQYAELTKLHQLVSLLVRSCDVSAKCTNSQNGPILPNPYAESTCQEYIMPLCYEASEILFGRTSYIKKIIEDSNITDESIKLLQFCSWENPHFSRLVLSELLWQIAYAYCQELRHHMDLLLAMLIIEDSWQTHRIHNAIKGVPEEREGLFDTIQRSKNHYQKRAYQCMKCMVTLFSKCHTALVILHTNADLRRKWLAAVEWLQDELERRYPPNTQYTYSTWSPPAQSNETTNGYFLERSNSARKTLERAYELCPEEEADADNTSGQESDQHSENGSVENEGQPLQELPDVLSRQCIIEETTSEPILQTANPDTIPEEHPQAT